MAPFKIETHLHTGCVSLCAHITPEEIVEGYLQAGYSGVVVTDHFDWWSFRVRDWLERQDALERYLEGYRQVKALGEPLGLRVYRGAEVRFRENDNDYLLYGWPDELLRDPGAVFEMGLARFSPLARSAGALLMQAHPYRPPCAPAAPAFLDGVEVRNMSPWHPNHNDLALEFAKANGLMGTCGSDCHETEHVAQGGICLPELPRDEQHLVSFLRAGRFSLL